MKKFFLTLCVVPALTTLVSCGSNRGMDALETGSQPFTESSLAQMVGKARPGDMLEFKNSSLLGTKTIVVGREYDSASGRTCKRLLNVAGSSLRRVVCEYSDNQWYVAKPLAGGKVSEPDLEALAREAGAGSPQPVSLDTDKVNEYAIRDGETLWSFSQRTTGNPNNWEAIANHNNIDDINRIPAGMMLEIPAGL